MFEVPSTLNLSGDGLVIGNLYTFNVSADEIVSDDPDFHDLTHTVSRSRSFFEFVPVAGSVPDVFLPMVGPDNVYHFEIIVEEGQPIIVDPEVAVGYDFMIGDGDPNFASVTLPTVGGDQEFALYLFDTMLDEYIFADDILAGGEHEFGADGVDRFRILGIDPAAMLDPNDVLAFQTTLTFVSDGEFTGTMTPITAEVTVSEPATLVLLGFGLGWLGLMRRREAA
jgi:hypothetical protein